MELTRREALGAIVFPTAATIAGLGSDARGASTAATGRAMKAAIAAAAGISPPQGALPGEVAHDEAFWFTVQQAFTVDRSFINLNNGGVSPTPAIVQQAMKRHMDHAQACPAHVLWDIQEPQVKGVCERLAREHGVAADEIAMTRNASESLQILQMGIDLRAGDEVLTTTQDYPRMINAFKQRQLREGIVLQQFQLPVPLTNPAEVVSLFDRRISSKTKLILVSHVVYLTGQILPVKEIVAAARAKGVPVIIDGAHAIGHIDFKIGELDCDFYGASMHKWICGPHGTGLLYVRRERIPEVWPLMASEPAENANIRKFEQIGTHPVAPYLAVAEALTFHQTIGPANKQARLAYLRDRWLNRLRERAGRRLKLLTNISGSSGQSGGACALATVQIEGLDSAELAKWLWSEHKILVAGIQHEEFHGIRVSPSVYTTLEELDRFGDVLESALRKGLTTKDGNGK